MAFSVRTERTVRAPSETRMDKVFWWKEGSSLHVSERRVAALEGFELPLLDSRHAFRIHQPNLLPATAAILCDFPVVLLQCADVKQ